MKIDKTKIILVVAILAALVVGTKYDAIAHDIYILGSVIFVLAVLIQCVQTKQYWVILALGLFLIIIILAVCLNAFS